MSEHDSSQPGSTTIALVAALLVCALVLGVAAYHAHAESIFRSSLPAGLPLETRYVRTRTAAALEPWNARYQTRERYVAAWLRAERLLEQGDYKAAVSLLTQTAGRTLAEPDLLALYRKAQAVQTAETNRKAHLQHGHEGAGGTLQPKDVER